MLALAAYTDWKTLKIHNMLTFSTMVTGAAYHLFFHGFQGFTASLAGLATGIGVLIIFYVMGGMGAGDVKLMGAVGAVLGAKGVFFSFLLTALFGGIYSLVVILMNRQIFRGFFRELLHTVTTFLLIKKYDPVRVTEHKNKPRLCYGMAIFLGTVTYMGLEFFGYGFYGY